MEKRKYWIVVGADGKRLPNTELYGAVYAKKMARELGGFIKEVVEEHKETRANGKRFERMVRRRKD